ncbi:hypothetical protein ABZZ47_39850 [Streptomyces sp. NPDC006465]
MAAGPSARETLPLWDSRPGRQLRRAVATRYDKTDTIYLSGLHFAAIVIW